LIFIIMGHAIARWQECGAGWVLPELGARSVLGLGCGKTRLVIGSPIGFGGKMGRFVAGADCSQTMLIPESLDIMSPEKSATEDFNGQALC
jgi:hypothetical protein